PTHHVVRAGHGLAQTELDGSQTLDDAAREVLVDVGDARQRGRHGSPGTQRGTGAVRPRHGSGSARGGPPLRDPRAPASRTRGSDSRVYRQDDPARGTGDPEVSETTSCM